VAVEDRTLGIGHAGLRGVATVSDVAPQRGRSGSSPRPADDPAGHRVGLLRHLPADGLDDVVVAAP
jgi:hypothetical protein